MSEVERKQNSGLRSKPSTAKCCMDPYVQRIPSNLTLGLNEELTDFDHLLAHHDARVANRLDAQYLQEEWEFPEVRIKDRPRLKDNTVICGDSRIKMTRHQKQSYRHLRSEVMKSQKMVHYAKGGFVRERPVTAPNLSMYSHREAEAFKRRQSQHAQSVIYNRLQNLLQLAYNSNTNASIEPVDTSDRPVIDSYKRCYTPKVVTDWDLKETAERGEQLLFDIETEEGRYEIEMDTAMEAWIPKYKKRKEEMDKNKLGPSKERKTSASPKKKVNQYEDAVNSLAYPIPRIPPSHSRKCDARFRGWYGVRSKKGSHYILMSPFFHNSPRGQLFQKLAKMSDAEIKKLHGQLLHRKTKSHEVDQRPVTAPAVMTMEEYQSKMKETAESLSKGDDSKCSRQSSGYGSMDEQSNKETPSPLSRPDADIAIIDETPEPRVESRAEISDESRHQSENEVIEMSPTPRDSTESSLSDKIRLLSVGNENSNKSGKPRAKSACTQRNDQLQNGDILLVKAAEGKYPPRSKSVAGTCVVPDVDEVAPMPYMDHSKPKVISVGSIGKISLLESISEAKYWEELVLEQQKQRLQAAAKSVEKPDTSTPTSKEEEAADDIFIEEKISSHSKKKGKPNSEELDETDILSMILDEEKRRKVKARRFNSKPKFGYSSAKSWSGSPSTSRTSRVGSSGSKSSESSAKTAEGPGTQKEPAQQKTDLVPTSNQIPQKNDEKINQVQKKVTLQDHKESMKQKEKHPVNKYERLVKRLGDDMTPYLKQQILKTFS